MPVWGEWVTDQSIEHQSRSLVLSSLGSLRVKVLSMDRNQRDGHIISTDFEGKKENPGENG